MAADPLVAGPAVLHGYRTVHEFLVEHPLVAFPRDALSRLIRRRRINDKQKDCKERNTYSDNTHPNPFKTALREEQEYEQRDKPPQERAKNNLPSRMYLERYAAVGDHCRQH
jgi:hypothetical protein